MTNPISHPVRLADDIARQLTQLAEHLSQAPSRQAAQILGRVLDCDEGILGRFTTLMVTGAHFAKDTSQHGILPPEVWLAIGRAANELHDIGLDLDEHAETLDALAGTASPTAMPKPVPTAMVVRRRR
ncbi:hypothetical protein [Streptomyces sp. ATCC 21386]|uniref:hypothetical protein n=1 Tax=Streptomyces sp. ATCC 21386 TaxID=2699428 RepID=UPI001BFFB84D|nr:hypothetical protein [Streptomyces sp. ATCC 21386]